MQWDCRHNEQKELQKENQNKKNEEHAKKAQAKNKEEFVLLLLFTSRLIEIYWL